jgi:hypothetical protein
MCRVFVGWEAWLPGVLADASIQGAHGRRTGDAGVCGRVVRPGDDLAGNEKEERLQVTMEREGR